MKALLSARAVSVFAVLGAVALSMGLSAPGSSATMLPHTGLAYEHSSVRYYPSEGGPGTAVNVAKRDPTKLMGELRLGGRNYAVMLTTSGFSCVTPDPQPCGDHTVAVTGTAHVLPTMEASSVGGSCVQPFSDVGTRQIACGLELIPPGSQVVTTFSVTLKLRHTAQAAAVDAQIDDINTTFECITQNEFGGCVNLYEYVPGPFALPYNGTFTQL